MVQRKIKIPHDGVTYYFYKLTRNQIACDAEKSDGSLLIYVKADNQQERATWPDFATAIYEVLAIALNHTKEETP